MTIYELEHRLVSERPNFEGDFVARLAYNYCGDTEIYISNEVFSVNENREIIWFNDWYEGQEEISLIGYYRIDYLVDCYRKVVEHEQS